MTTTHVQMHNGIPSLFLNGCPVAPIAAYVGPQFVKAFREAGIQLYTFTIPGKWWVGPGEYDFGAVDAFMGQFLSAARGALCMARIYLGHQGFPWWGEAHPGEMNVLRDVVSGEVCDPLKPNPQAVSYLGHEVRLEGINLHSFHSQVWRRDAGQAVAALVSHCEAAPYADQIWGWHLCDGLFQEWFHWSEYAFGAMADYAPTAQVDFRRWLRRTYHDDAGQLSRAWGRPVDFDAAGIPSPQERSRPAHGEFYDPVRDRPAIDYAQCFSDAMVDSITAICQAVKHALPQPKVTCVFYGYQFSDMPRPQFNAHYALDRLLASPAVDLVASPHAYSNRGLGGYHSPQAVVDAIRRAGKLHFDEVDCKTVWTPPSVTWKVHISQPESVEETVEMMKKDAAYALASGTAQWWMDLTNQGWFDAPEAVEPMRKLKAIAERLQSVDLCSFGEVALVVSQRAMMFQAPRAGLHNATLLMFRNWHLSRMGAPFEQLTIQDLRRPDLPAYKLYIMANAFYLSAEQRVLIDRVVKRNGATVLWIYAPGYLDDRSASLANMEALTGFRFGMSDISAELNVTMLSGTGWDHAITRDLPQGYAYGGGVDREQYLRAPRIEYMPETTVRPAFFVDDVDARVLGLAQSTGKPGLVCKEFGDWRSIYSAAPLLPWQLMRNIARYAGVHVYDDQGDMLWANDAFLALYAQRAGLHTIRFPRPVTVQDAYEGQELGVHVCSLDLEMDRWETRLLFTT